ncbi:hypothetical protein SIO70_11785 [Chitinophaga sancti]|uniref:hypothetical protein n=1 Tax=Chitinophaga sancti TaxID=1004 RepID=UPI002A757477|nr:hypothetical protein [Chitinophaga sancti]WPQ65529.1 hypothetical protein SIO70_11785 [Chitinophaga sancti]
MEKQQLKVIVHNKKEEVPETKKLKSVWGSKERIEWLRQTPKSYQTKIINIDDYKNQYQK